MAKRTIRDLGQALAPYLPMLQGFVNGLIDYDAFETDFYAMYLDDETPWSDDVFRMLDGFFHDVDSCVDIPFVPDPKLKEIGPEELRERAIVLLRAGGYEA
jgi:hypothetical protein